MKFSLNVHFLINLGLGEFFQEECDSSFGMEKLIIKIIGYLFNMIHVMPTHQNTRECTDYQLEILPSQQRTKLLSKDRLFVIFKP